MFITNFTAVATYSMEYFKQRINTACEIWGPFSNGSNGLKNVFTLSGQYNSKFK